MESEESLQSGQLSAEDAKLLEDGQEGLLLEDKTGKCLIKAGRLVKLVERLADHRFIDSEYRSVFLLTYPSFTSAVELIDLLIKRYNISPPYGLDQRAFDIFVNKKIGPIRLR